MDDWLLLVVVGALALIPVAAWVGDRRKKSLARRRDFIRSYRFPAGVIDKLRAKHPQLTPEQVRVVESALRDFFLFHLRSGNTGIGMPSRVTDDLWHEFILDTKAYAAFCERAFGRFFHHIPSGGMGHGKKEDAALRRTWRLACVAEQMHPRKARRLPLIFGVDKQLAIAGGLVYSLQFSREDARKDGGGCGGGACGGGGLASGDGSGCAGGGCGGGCGGS